MVISPWDGGTRLYEAALDVRSATHEIVASNVANEETPGYKASRLPFKEALDTALSETSPLEALRAHPKHFPIVNSNKQQFQEAIRVEAGTAHDGNSVNLEQEMTLMAENTLIYQAVSQILRGRFQAWSNAISEGRGR